MRWIKVCLIFTIMLNIFCGYTYATEESSVGKYIVFGSYRGIPTTYYIAAQKDVNGDGILDYQVISTKTLTFKGMCGGSGNLWKSSALRQWMNSEDETIAWSGTVPDAQVVQNYPYDSEKGFMANGNMTQKERDLILDVTNHSLAPNRDLSEGGNEALYWNDGGYVDYKRALQNYDNAYYTVSREKVFIPSIKDLTQMDLPYSILAAPTAVTTEKNATADSSTILLRDSGDLVQVRYYSAYNTIHIINANSGNAGIRPVFYIDGNVLLSGEGSSVNPYSIGEPLLISSTNVSTSGEQCTYSVTFKNMGMGDEYGSLILGVFGANGRLEGFQTADGAVLPGRRKTIDITMSNSMVENKTVRVFYWKDLNKLQPIAFKQSTESANPAAFVLNDNMTLKDPNIQIDGNPVENAFDGNNSNVFAVSNLLNDKITFKFKYPANIKQISILPSKNSYWGMSKKIEVWACDDEHLYRNKENNTDSFKVGELTFGNYTSTLLLRQTLDLDLKNITHLIFKTIEIYENGGLGVIWGGFSSMSISGTQNTSELSVDVISNGKILSNMWFADKMGFTQKSASECVTYEDALIAINKLKSHSSGNYVGSYVNFGSYRGKPVRYYIADQQDINNDGKNELLLVASNVLTYKAFSANSLDNLWGNSSLQQWLNSLDAVIQWNNTVPDATNLQNYPYADEKGFMADGNMTEEERNLIVPVYHKYIVGSADKSVGGTETFNWNDGDYVDYKRAVQNYDIAYYAVANDKVFIPSIKELAELDMPYSVIASNPSSVSEPNISGLDGQFLLRDAAGNDKIRFYYRYNSISATEATNGKMGVRPMLYLDGDIVLNGNGSEQSPSEIILPNSSGETSITATQYYNMLLDTLGYEPSEVNLREIGLGSVIGASDFTIRDMCIATFEALMAKPKNYQTNFAKQLYTSGLMEESVYEHFLDKEDTLTMGSDAKYTLPEDADMDAMFSFTLPSTAKVVRKTNFCYNIPFHYQGSYLGTLPVSDTNSKRVEFAQALSKAGAKSLRFPGGLAAHQYFVEGEQYSAQLTRDLMKSAGAFGGLYNPDDQNNSYYIDFYNYLDFCTEYNIEPIFQVNTCFYLDENENKVCSIYPTTYMAKSATEFVNGYYDRNRISEAAEQLGKNIDRMMGKGCNVKYWEIGNEDYSTANYLRTELSDPNNPATQNYIDVSTAFIKVIKEKIPDAKIVVTDGFPNMEQEYRANNVYNMIDYKAVHYPFAAWPTPPSTERANLARFVGMNDVNFVQSAGITAETDLTGQKMLKGVTETAVWRYQSWDNSSIQNTFAMALNTVHNWGELVFETPVAISTLHDLESPFFGAVLYDVTLNPYNRSFRWGSFMSGIPEDDISNIYRFENSYFLTPSAKAFEMLSRHVDGKVLKSSRTSVNRLVSAYATVKENEVLLTINNRLHEAASVSVVFDNISINAQSATAEVYSSNYLGASLVGEYKNAEQVITVKGNNGNTSNSALELTVLPYSFTTIIITK